MYTVYIDNSRIDMLFVGPPCTCHKLLLLSVSLGHSVGRLVLPLSVCVCGLDLSASHGSSRFIASALSAAAAAAACQLMNKLPGILKLSAVATETASLLVYLIHTWRFCGFADHFRPENTGQNVERSQPTYRFRNFEKGAGQKTVYQPRRHLSQMHTTN